MSALRFYSITWEAGLRENIGSQGRNRGKEVICNNPRGVVGGLGQVVVEMVKSDGWTLGLL